MSSEGGAHRGRARQEYRSEAREAVDQLGGHLLRLEEQSRSGQPDPELVNAAFRAAHSLKGTSSLFGADRVSVLAHRMEDLLDEVRMGGLSLSGDVLDVLFDGVEMLEELVAGEGVVVDEGRLDALEAGVRLLLSHAAQSDDFDPRAHYDLDVHVIEQLTEYESRRLCENARSKRGLYRVRAALDLADFDVALARLSETLKAAGEVISTLPVGAVTDDDELSFDLLLGSDRGRAEILGELSDVEAEVNRIGPAMVAGPEGTSSWEREDGRAAEATAEQVSADPPVGLDAMIAGGVIDDVSDEAASDPSATRDRPTSPDAGGRTVRVDIGKLDELMNIVGDLVLSRTGIQRLSEGLERHGVPRELALDLHKETRNLERRLRLLKQGVLEVRMVPLAQILDRLSRMLRKMAREAGKEVMLKVEGSDTELDKLIIEQISDPLMHIMRNAVDHGIECPLQRERRGKPAAGTIRIFAHQRGSHVTIEVGDDGAGMDSEAMARRGVELGMIDVSDAKAISSKDALNLIFAPGFSMKEQVSDVSGRGVGMDVVRTNISSISGVIDLRSELGTGSTVVITIPVTLAMVQGLIACVAGQIFALPVSGVIEILRVKRADIETKDGGERLERRGRTVPLVRLARVFGLDEAGAGEAGDLFVVLVGLAGNEVGIVVDELLGQQDIVTKALGPRFSGIRGIAGATDLGDNTATLVVDVVALMEDALGRDIHKLVAP